MKILVSLFVLTLLLFGLNLYRLSAISQSESAEPIPTSTEAKLPALLPDQHIASMQQSGIQPFRLQWGSTPEAPFHILTGPDQGMGFCDVLFERLQVYLPDVRHQLLVEPQNRIRQRMNEKENMCYPCALFVAENAERQGRVFSKPTHYYRPHGIITRPELAEVISQRFGNPVDLTKLLGSELRFGFPLQRRYGKLQPLLDNHRIHSPSHISFDTGQDASMLHLQMLSNQQLDITIDYVSSLNYYVRHARQPLVFLPIKGYEDWLAGAVACPDTDWGQRAVARIDDVVNRIREDKTLRQSLQFWFGETLPPYPAESKHEARDNPQI